MVPNAPSRLSRVHRKLLGEAQRALPDLGRVGFEIRADAGDGGRHYAYCQQSRDGSIKIAFSPNALALSDAHLLGLMAHELGHAIDFRYPPQRLTQQIGDSIPRERERRADEIARRVFGHVIEYDPRIGYVQCVACDGVAPRPKGLR